MGSSPPSTLRSFRTKHGGIFRFDKSFRMKCIPMTTCPLFVFFWVLCRFSPKISVSSFPKSWRVPPGEIIHFRDLPLLINQAVLKIFPWLWTPPYIYIYKYNLYIYIHIFHYIYHYQDCPILFQVCPKNHPIRYPVRAENPVAKKKTRLVSTDWLFFKGESHLQMDEDGGKNPIYKWIITSTVDDEFGDQKLPNSHRGVFYDPSCRGVPN